MGVVLKFHILAKH